MIQKITPRQSDLIQVEKYFPDRKREWDRFVLSSNNGTVFHQQAFLDYHLAGRFHFHHLMFYQDQNLVAVLPACLDGGILKSPAGASFGGFVTQKGFNLSTAEKILKSLLSYCIELNLNEIQITPPMQIYYQTMDEAMEFAMLYNGFEIKNCLYSSVIDLIKVKDKHDLSKNTRHKINKALNKGVRIVKSDDFSRFYPILLQNKAKFGVKPTHSLEELYAIEKLLPGMMVLFLAYLDKQPIAGELLFKANPKCMLNFYTMHLYEYRNWFPVNLLVEHAIQWSAARGYQYYDYGVSADTFSSNPMEPSRSLIKFKESMGSNGCIRKTFHKILS